MVLFATFLLVVSEYLLLIFLQLRSLSHPFSFHLYMVLQWIIERKHLKWPSSSLVVCVSFIDGWFSFSKLLVFAKQIESEIPNSGKCKCTFNCVCVYRVSSLAWT